MNNLKEGDKLVATENQTSAHRSNLPKKGDILTFDRYDTRWLLDGFIFVKEYTEDIGEPYGRISFAPQTLKKYSEQ